MRATGGVREWKIVDETLVGQEQAGESSPIFAANSLRLDVLNAKTPPVPKEGPGGAGTRTATETGSGREDRVSPVIGNA